MFEQLLLDQGATSTAVHERLLELGFVVSAKQVRGLLTCTNAHRRLTGCVYEALVAEYQDFDGANYVPDRHALEILCGESDRSILY